jgi:hypothetical protein
MKGTIVIISQHRGHISKDIDRPELKYFTDAVGGYIEVVPYFTSIVWDGQLHECVAFCDEEGKIKRKEPNVSADLFWRMAQERAGLKMMIDDYLVGDICVVFGDKEFMREL